VVVIDPDVRRAAGTLLDRMLGLGGELVTLLPGADVPAGLADELVAHITATFPGVEVVVYVGGQSTDLIQIGVE
jgi:dihydroxyacetone kinase-like predicted kinase